MKRCCSTLHSFCTAVEDSDSSINVFPLKKELLHLVARSQSISYWRLLSAGHWIMANGPMDQQVTGSWQMGQWISRSLDHGKWANGSAGHWIMANGPMDQQVTGSWQMGQWISKSLYQ
jgi:hypothetical protein